MVRNNNKSASAPVNQKLELISAWLTQNSHLLDQSQKMEIILSLAGTSVKGKITLFPESI
jgi:hypothetical protein